jgi:hypothetical protein
MICKWWVLSEIQSQELKDNHQISMRIFRNSESKSKREKKREKEKLYAILKNNWAMNSGGELCS